MLRQDVTQAKLIVKWCLNFHVKRLCQRLGVFTAALFLLFCFGASKLVLLLWLGQIHVIHVVVKELVRLSALFVQSHLIGGVLSRNSGRLRFILKLHEVILNSEGVVHWRTSTLRLLLHRRWLLIKRHLRLWWLIQRVVLHQTMNLFSQSAVFSLQQPILLACFVCVCYQFPF